MQKCLSTHCSNNHNLIDVVSDCVRQSGVTGMQKLGQLEKAVAILLEQHRCLKDDNARLRYDKECWLQEKQRLLTEVDRILERLDDIDVEDL